MSKPWRTFNDDCIRKMRGEVCHRKRNGTNPPIFATITDPPYGIGYKSATGRFPKILNDDKLFLEWIRPAFKLTVEGGCLLCFCGWSVQEEFKREIERVGYVVKAQLVWDRCLPGRGNLKGAPAPQHDCIWFATKGNFEFHGGRPATVLRFPREPAQGLVHPTEKPVSLMMDLVKSYVPRGKRVLDPFMGSGSTGVACVRTTRRFYGFELDPGYYETASSRIQKEIEELRRQRDLQQADSAA